MKSKNLLPIILIFIFSLNSIAQKSIVPDNTYEFDPEKVETAKKDRILKSSNETMYLLDSVKRTQYIRIRDTMQVYTYYYNYDSEGRPTSRIMRTSCEVCQGSDQDYKNEYQYDENDNVIVEFQYSMDKDAQQWIPETKCEYSYNDNGIVTNQMEYVWNLNQWMIFGKTEVSYNENGETEHYCYSNYNADDDSWIIQQESDYYFDSNGYDSLTVHSYLSSDGTYYESLKYEFTVDSEGRETEEVSQYKDTSEIWTNNSMYHYEYDQNGNTILSESSYWNSTYNIWQPSSKRESEYDISNHIIFNIYYYWDSNSNEWAPSSRNDYEYNMMGQTISYFLYRWNSNLDEWQNYTMRTFEYDENNISIGYEYFLWQDQAWWKSEKVEYFYHEFTVGLNLFETDLSQVNVYPNPAKETVTIKLQSANSTIGTIYNSTGESLKTLSIHQGENSFDISDLKSGLYILQIQLNEGLFSQKLIKN